MRHREPEKPGRIRRLLQSLRRGSRKPLDAVRPATAYPHRAGAYLTRDSALGHLDVTGGHQDDRTQVLPMNARLMTRGAEYRSSFALKQRNGR